MASLFSLPFGKLADKLTRKKVLFLSGIFFALMCITFLYFSSPLGVFLSFMLYGLHLASLIPARTTLAAELCPRRYRASSLGTFQMIIGLCALPSSLIAGLLWSNFGKLAPFQFSLFLMCFSLFLLAFVKEV